jgi:hypothetical protein
MIVEKCQGDSWRIKIVSSKKPLRSKGGVMRGQYLSPLSPSEASRASSSKRLSSQGASGSASSRVVRFVEGEGNGCRCALWFYVKLTLCLSTHCAGQRGLGGQYNFCCPLDRGRR